MRYRDIAENFADFIDSDEFFEEMGIKIKPMTLISADLMRKLLYFVYKKGYSTAIKSIDEKIMRKIEMPNEL